MMTLKKLFFNKSNSITSAAFLIGVFAFLSRVLGLVRARVFAYQFGAGIQLDMYYAAFRLPDLIYNLVVMGAISSAFIPVFTSYRVKNNKEEGKNHWQLANNLLHVLSGVIFLLSLVLIAFAPYIVGLIAPGFSQTQKEVTTALTRIMLIQPIILAASGVISGVLQSYKTFFAYALAPCLYNIGIIMGALVFAPQWGVFGLAFGVLLGALFHLGIQIPALKNTGYSYQFFLDLKEKGLRKIIKLALPRSLGLAAMQVNIIVMTAIASTMALGSISVFNYANDIQYAPLGIVGVAFATAAFPSLSEKFAQKDIKKFCRHLNESMRKIIFLVVPIAILFFVLRFEIVNLILKTGEFSLNDVWLTASCLALFTIGIPFQSLIPILSRSFYALHNTIKPVLINSAAVLVNIILSLWLVNFIQQNNTLFLPLFQYFNLETMAGKEIIGLPFAYSIGGIINTGFLAFFLRKEIKNLALKEIFISSLKIFIAGIGLFIATKAILGLIDPSKAALQSLAGGLTAGIGGGVTYLALTWLLKSRELESFLKELPSR